MRCPASTLHVLTLSLALAASLTRPAHAAPMLDPDAESALRHFDDGRRQLEVGNATGALASLEAARRLRPMPVFEFYIASTLERLARWPEAIEAYQRYLAGRHDAPDAAAVRDRITAIAAGRYPTFAAANAADPAREASTSPAGRRGRQAPLAPAPAVVDASAPAPSAPSSQPLSAASPVDKPGKRYAAPIALAVVTVALVAGGASLLGTVGPDYTTLHDQCARMACDASRIDALELRAHLGYALLGTAGATAVVDAILWAVAARRRTVPKRLALAPTLGGVLLSGSF